VILERAQGTEAARAAARALRGGGVVLLPTDTVYGLACSPLHPAAVDAVYALKARPRERRLPVIVAGAPPPDELGLRFGDAAERLARAFWPGALTIVVGVAGPAPDWLADRDEVGIRAPASDIARALAADVGPYLMTSANLHGRDTPATLESALGGLRGEPDVAIDGGSLSVVSSTVVNVNLPRPEIEREGAIASARIAEVLGNG
jgi:L-threonylcarbamoyladenylate synthase